MLLVLWRHQGRSFMVQRVTEAYLDRIPKKFRMEWCLQIT
jgi:hypothetical protein